MFAGVVAFALEHWTWGAALAAPLAYLTPAGPILAFLKANWKWALPVLAVVAIGIDDGIQRIRVGNLRAEIAEGEAKRAQAVLEQKERDRVLAAQLSAELADANARTAGTVTTRTEVIYREKPVVDHLDTPALRESDAGLLELGFRRPARSGAAGAVDAAPAP